MNLKDLHELKINAQKTAAFFELSENEEISNCAYYGWDENACEEYCTADTPTKNRQNRKLDFDSKKECWQCINRKSMVI